MKKRIFVLGLLVLLCAGVLSACDIFGSSKLPRVNSFIVTFDSKSGSAVEDIEVEAGESIDEEPVSTRKGYIFDGWYDYRDDKVVFPYTPQNDETLTAKWTVSASVTLDARNGTEPTVFYAEKGKLLAEPSAPSREGFSFHGWYTGNANEYYWEKYNFDFVLNSNVKLYAKWGLADFEFDYKYGYGEADEPYLLVKGTQSGAEDLIIPTEFEGFEVKGIAEAGFSGNEKLKSVVVHEGIARIVDGAFKDCSALENVELREGLLEIGEIAFEGCSALRSVDIPKSVRMIRAYAFKGCVGLTEFYYPEGVEYPGQYSLQGCDNIVELTVYSSEMLENSNLLDFVFGSKNPASLKKVVFLTGKNLYHAALSDCTLIEEIVLPDTLENAGFGFSGLTKLKTINLPDSLTILTTNNFFYNCPEIEYETVDRNLLYVDNHLIKIQTAGAVVNPTLKEGTVGIAAHAFENANALITINLTSSLRYIGDYAFDSCLNLENVTIGQETPLWIGYNVFRDCFKFKTFFIPSNVVFIGDYYGIPNGFTALYLGVTEIPETWNFTVSEYDKCYWDVQKLGEDENYKYVLTSDSAILIKYKGDAVNLVASKIEGLPIATIDDYAFENNTNIVSVELPSTVASLGVRAFRGCTSLETINIPEGVSAIPFDAFEYCASLLSVVVPESVTKIGLSAFYGCSLLSSVVFEGEGLVEIGGYAFYKCSALKKVVLPLSVRIIGVSAFESCGVEEINIPLGVERIEERTFFYTQLKEIVLPESVTFVGGAAINCWNLTRVEILGEVVVIEGLAFWSTSIEDVIIHSTVPPVLEAEDIFYEVNNITFHVPASSLEVYKAADVWKNFSNFVAIA